MGDIVIKYGDLKDMAKQARRVADKCGDYVEELSKKLTDKRNSLPESPTGKGNSHIDSMCYYVNAKKRKLEKKQEVYKAFATKAEHFSEHAQEADGKVAKSVNRSRDNFLKEHKNLKGDGWTAFFASISIECPFLGKLFDLGAAVADGIKDLKNNLRYWYEVCGGKKLIDNLLAVGELVLAGIGIVVATIALFSNPVGWFAIAVAVAGFVGAVIGLSDAIYNLKYQLRANQETDPAWAQYYGKIDTTADMFRKRVFKEKWLNRWSDKIALGLDVTSFVCSVIDITDSLGNLYKRSGLKKLFSSPVTVNGKKVYKFDFSRMWHTVTSKEGWKNIKKSLKFSWKGVLFGDKGNFAQRWKRAFTSKDTKLSERVKKIANMLKYTLNSPMKHLKNVNKGLGLLSQKSIGIEDMHGIIKNLYSSTGWSGGNAAVLDAFGTFKYDAEDLGEKIRAAYEGAAAEGAAGSALSKAILNKVRNRARRITAGGAYVLHEAGAQYAP